MLMPHGWEGRTQPDRQLQQRGPERETPKEPTAWIHQGDNKRLRHVGAGGDGVLRDMGDGWAVSITQVGSLLLPLARTHPPHSRL